jgi:hypothetical protein
MKEKIEETQKASTLFNLLYINSDEAKLPTTYPPLKVAREVELN